MELIHNMLLIFGIAVGLVLVIWVKVWFWCKVFGCKFPLW